MTEIALHRAFTERGHTVTYAHWDSGRLSLVRERGVTYLTQDAYETKVHDYSASLSGISDTARQSKAALLLKVEAEIDNPTEDFTVTRRGDGLYVRYPSFKIDVRDIDGFMHVASGHENGATINQVLDFREKLEGAGIIPLNKAADSRVAESKLQTQELFEANGIPTPKSLCFRQEGKVFPKEPYRKQLEGMGAHEWVVKAEYASHGEGNFYTSSVDEALEHMQRLMAEGNNVVVQEKIPGRTGDSKSPNFRLAVIKGEKEGDEKVIGGYYTVFPEGSQYIPTHEMDFSQAQYDLAIRIARLSKLDHVAVDMGGRGETMEEIKANPVAFEMNPAGALWVHQFHGQNSMLKTIKHFEQKIEKQRIHALS
ncbi:MAG TPA: hypothetical protein VFT64_06890 [Rickettsiales bacterium]|nr:hypothetical protein [Rickettsiales bacterium]